LLQKSNPKQIAPKMQNQACSSFKEKIFQEAVINRAQFT
jgi:hypothetical protein